MTTTNFTPLTHMYDILTQIAQEKSGKRNKTISRLQYDIFCNEYIFSAIKGKKFGAAFCEKFDIPDYLLLFEPSVDQAKKYIETSGYIKPK